ncbi:hypothetical protein TcG_01497 [Trypanosoma cruzi]|nr:hypothetical protein TcG_01497 [Trypanosoma cruzi]
MHILAVSTDDFLSTCCTRRHTATPRTIWWSAAAKRQQCLSKPSSGTSYPRTRHANTAPAATFPYKWYTKHLRREAPYAPNQHRKELQVYDAPRYSRKEGNMALELF